MRPDFFIVGVPKSGTTALKQYLSQHPQIFIPSEVNEFHFFGGSERQGKLNPANTLDEYLSYFNVQSDKGIKRAGEKSVWYFYSEQARNRIKSFQPNADIIIMLRNPVEMVYSLHSQLLYGLEEDEQDFKKALRLESKRRLGEYLPKGAHTPWKLYYREIGKYTEQLIKWLDLFDEDKVHVVLYDDFKKDTEKEYKNILAGLKVDMNLVPNFNVVNPNTSFKSPGLQNIVRFKAGPVWRSITPTSMRKKIRIGSKIKSLNTKTEQRSPLAEDTRQLLKQEYKEDVERLSNLLNRDLLHWVR